MTTTAGSEGFSPKTVDLHGIHLVEAGAGTGKTHAIVELFVRLLLERDLDVSQILIVTYTIAATAELRRRIRSRLVELAREGRSEKAADALRAFDGAAIFTIHGFCQRILRERAFESGSSFESELVSDADALLEEVAQDFWVREMRSAPVTWVRQLAAWGWGPSRLAVLAAQVAARPDLVLQPPRPQAVEVEAAAARWASAQLAVARTWDEGGEEALASLEGAALAGELHKGRHKPELVAALGPALREQLQVEDPVRSLRERVPKFQLLEQSRIRKNTSKGFEALEHPFFLACDELTASEAHREEQFAAQLLAFLHDFVGYAREELARRKGERDILFFDDLLLRLSGALDGEEGDRLARVIRRRYPVALIDEFQDTDPVQYAVFRRVWPAAAENSLFLIGDPKQAIYGFRGADVFAYLEARGDAGAVHSLTRNWRSDPALLDGLNAVFGAEARPFSFEEIPYEPAVPRPGAKDALRGERIRSGLRVLDLEPDEGGKLGGDWRGTRLARAVAAEVARILSSEHEIEHEAETRSLQPRDIAVLTRMNRQARDVQDALREYGIASVLQSAESVFASEESAELERVLRAVADADDPARVRAAVATTLFSRSSEDCIGVSGGDAEEEAAWEDWGSGLRECRQIWTEQGLPRALRQLFAARGVVERLLARADGERRVTNLHHVIELLHREATEARLGPLSLVHWFARRRAEALAGGRWVSEEAQLRLESDAEAVQLLTVHRAKGLQFPITICPFLWDGTLTRTHDPLWRYHAPESGELTIEPRSPKDLATPGAKPCAEEEAFAENLRVAYVGLTRARHHCSVVWGDFQKKESSPLRHFVLPAERCADPSNGDVKAAFEAAAARSNGGLWVEPLDRSPALRLLPSDAGAPEASRLESRVASRSFHTWWRVSSFSGLVAFAGDDSPEFQSGRVGPELEEGHDYDARTEEGGAPVLQERGAPALRESDAPGEPEATDGPVRLAGFPAGAMPGILIHEVFEEIDFEEPGDLETLVSRKLRARNIAQRWTPVLADAVRDVLAVPLEPRDPESALARVARADRIDEMPFTLPVSTRREHRALSAADLAEAFERHGESELVRAYAARAARLGFTPLAGHLRGFVDLVFRARGRWYLVDYKSNHLGPRATDYGVDAMTESMLEHDYVLQYHLYCVALHRHLEQRLPGYDYDEHMGGAYYLFVRGMAPGHPAGSGVLFDRPSRALIEALAELLS